MVRRPCIVYYSPLQKLPPGNDSDKNKINEWFNKTKKAESKFTAYYGGLPANNASIKMKKLIDNDTEKEKMTDRNISLLGAMTALGYKEKFVEKTMSKIRGYIVKEIKKDLEAKIPSIARKLPKKYEGKDLSTLTVENFDKLLGRMLGLPKKRKKLIARLNKIDESYRSFIESLYNVKKLIRDKKVDEDDLNKKSEELLIHRQMVN